MKNNTSWADSTKMNIYFTVARYLEINKPEDTFIDQFKQKGWDIKQHIEKIEGQNKLDAKEELYYRDCSYFVEILKSTNYKDLSTQTEHYKYLILSLLIKQPPLRTSFCSSALIVQKKASLSRSGELCRGS